jgi:C4-dicarboxylate transporter, DctQ subunit
VPVRDWVNRVEEGLIALILAVMTVLTFVQVVLRYVFNTGFLWALEANFYLFAWLVLIGISYCVRTHAHIGVDAAIRLMSPAVRRWIGLFVVGLVLVYAGLMLYGSLVYIDKMREIGIEAEDIPVERWILSLCLPLGFFLLILRILGMAWRIVTGQSGGYELGDEAADALKELAGDKQPDGTTVAR